MITEFQGEYRWLSNFWPSRVELSEIGYPTVEHAFVAGKTMDPLVRHTLKETCKTPGEAKIFGRALELREDCEEVKIPLMKYLLTQKFQDPELKQKLLDTGDQELIEGNTWNDTFWGVCDGVGENHLGKLLMEVREEIRCSI